MTGTPRTSMDSILASKQSVPISIRTKHLYTTFYQQHHFLIQYDSTSIIIIIFATSRPRRRALHPTTVRSKLCLIFTPPRAARR